MRTINDGFPIKQFKGIDIDTSIQSSSANYYTYSSRVVKFIVIHYTGNTNQPINADIPKSIPIILPISLKVYDMKKAINITIQ